MLGLVAAAFGWANDLYLRQSKIASDLVPISVYGLVLLSLLVINPLMGWLRLRRLSGAEYAVFIAMMLAAVIIPGPAMMWNFSSTVVMPYHHQTQLLGWQKVNAVGLVPEVMLVDAGQPKSTDNRDWTNSRQVVDGYRTGLRGGETLIGFDEVPWSAWTRTLSFYLPLFALLFIGSLAVAMILHPQWAHRERLRYPIAIFATELLTAAEPRSQRSIFRNGLFWLGLSIALVILLINGLHAYYPDVPEIPNKFRMGGFLQKWPWLRNLPQHTSLQLFSAQFWFVGIGLAYLVSSDVSFSIGISTALFAAVFLVLYNAGVKMDMDYLEGGVQGYQLFGSYLALGVLVIYLGRRYYSSVLARMFFLPAGEKIEGGTLWAGWIALLSGVGMVLLLIFVLHLHWLLAILMVGLVTLLYLVVTRISVESGLFYIQPWWQPAGVLLALFGIKALGPNMLAIVAVLSIILTVDPRLALMPLAANALRIGETQTVRPQRIARWMGLAVLAALLVGVVGTIYFQYSYGGGLRYNWGTVAAAMPFDTVVRNLPKFGDFDIRQKIPFDFAQIAASKTFLAAAGAGFLLVVVCSALRLRFTWWPIHPVLFLVWGTAPAQIMGYSFLLGWLLKTAVSRLGGGKGYEKGKGFFIGLVAGEFIAGIIWMIVGYVYRLVEGTGGPWYSVHP